MRKFELLEQLLLEQKWRMLKNTLGIVLISLCLLYSYGIIFYKIFFALNMMCFVDMLSKIEFVFYNAFA